MDLPAGTPLRPCAAPCEAGPASAIGEGVDARDATSGGETQLGLLERLIDTMRAYLRVG